MMKQSNDIKAGIIVKTRFIDKTLQKKDEKAFESYVDYLDRDEAVRKQHFNEFSLYNDYMDNPEKMGALFTEQQDSLSKEQKQKIKELFKKAFDNDSIMWQTVISFDNRYLAKMGVYDPVTKTLDENKMRECTRAMMKNMLDQEDMSMSGLWSASVHYNTDNIHIHVATVEPNPTRKKRNINGKLRPQGTISQKTRRAMKSNVVNTILQADREMMDEIVRNKIIRGKNSVWSFEHPELARRFVKLYRKLPADRRKWFYNMNAMKPFRNEIDDMTRVFVRIYYQKEFAEYQRLLVQEQETFKEAYGENSKADDYAKNKMNDFYQRMGNAILKEMREYSKIIHSPAPDKISKHGHKQSAAHISGLHGCLNGIKNALQAEWKQRKLNQKAYHQLESNLSMDISH
ncbi:MobP2 family relaxase [Massiliimalia timonensis]|uniref:MobP2 family relaxase n=1 Tax=Massiliimalia timonensis TaxID=1987501 RepID=UPI0018A0AFD7|nr:MobP2 family relaxase [Massiliimalia timonensis]